MSVKIKVSYTDDKELSEVLKRLHPVKRVRPQRSKGYILTSNKVVYLLIWLTKTGGRRQKIRKNDCIPTLYVIE